jgi:hypothetical protein
MERIYIYLLMCHIDSDCEELDRAYVISAHTESPELPADYEEFGRTYHYYVDRVLLQNTTSIKDNYDIPENDLKMRMAVVEYMAEMKAAQN